MSMKERLKEAYESIRKKDPQAAAGVVEELKKLPRTQEGIFDMESIDPDRYEAARWVYPVYAAYETACNKKEGYPDILAQIRTINKLLKQDYTFENAAAAADMLIRTIDCMSPEIYEYYRELVDIFKENVKEIISRYLKEDGDSVWAGKDSRACELFRGAVRQACQDYVLLTEKYQVFC